MCGAAGLLGTLTLEEQFRAVTCQRCRVGLRALRSRRREARHRQWFVERAARRALEPPPPVDHARILDKMAIPFEFFFVGVVGAATFMDGLAQIESEQVRRDVLAVVPDAQARTARAPSTA